MSYKNDWILKIPLIIINFSTNIIVFNTISDNYYFKLSLILNKI